MLALPRAGADEGEPGLAEVREADAGDVAKLRGRLRQPTRLLSCLISGKITDTLYEQVVRAASATCAPGATAIWTRHSPGAGPEAAESGHDSRGAASTRSRRSTRWAPRVWSGRWRQIWAASSRPWRGGGRPVVCVQDGAASADPIRRWRRVHIAVPAAEIEAIDAAHRVGADGATELAAQPWGEREVFAVIVGYRFLIQPNRRLDLRGS